MTIYPSHHFAWAVRGGMLWRWLKQRGRGGASWTELELWARDHVGGRRRIVRQTILINVLAWLEGRGKAYSRMVDRRVRWYAGIGGVE